MAEAAGAVRIYKAAISGFDITETDPNGAGWTRLTGTSDLGQSATHLLVMDNGVQRWAFDKNSTSSGAVKGAFSDGSTWTEVVRNEQDWDNPTATEFKENTEQEATVEFTFNDRHGNPSTHELTMQAALRFLEWKVVDWASSTGDAGEHFFQGASGALFNKHFTAQGGLVSPPTAVDPSGTPTLTTDPVLLMSSADAAFDMVVFSTENAPVCIFGTTVSESQVFGIDSANVTAGKRFWLGAIPRAYTNKGGALSDATRRNAEDYPVWEGERPLVGTTNLLTNGGFETDLTGWTQTSGAWTRVTTQKKFGTASVQVTADGTNKTLTQAVPGLVIGAKYAMMGWARIQGGAGGGKTKMNLGGTTTDSNSILSSAGQVEWHHLALIFTATATSHDVKLIVESTTTTGTIQFDGIALYEVEDDSGNKKLTLDTATTDGWSGESSFTGAAIIDGPRGKAVEISMSTGADTTRAAFVTLAASIDLTAYDYLAVWVKPTGNAPGGNWTFGMRSGGTVFTTSSLNTSIQGEWSLLVFNIMSRKRDSVDRFYFYPGSFSGAGTYQISTPRVTAHDIRVGQKHGVLDPMADEDLMVWLKLDDAPTGSELITNGGFETYTTSPGVPDSWSDNSGGTATFEEETTITRSGNNAVKATHVGGAGGLFQALPVTAGKSYYIEAYARTGGAAGDKARLGVFNTTDAQYEVLKEGTAASTSFEKLSGTFLAAAGKTYRVVLNTSGGTDDVLYWDDVTVKEIQAVDHSGQGNHGYLTGGPQSGGPTILETGQIASAMSFDGVDDGVAVPDSATLDSIVSRITVSCWVYARSLPSGAGVTASIATRGVFNLSVNPSTEGNGAAFFVNLAGVSEPRADNSVALPLNQWVHLVGTYDGAWVRLYQDGVLIESQARTGTLSATNSSLRFGVDVAGTTSHFDGILDDAKVLRRAWGADEVAREFYYGRLGKENVSGWYVSPASATLQQSTDAKEGGMALVATNLTGGGGEMLAKEYRSLDLSQHRYLALWDKKSAGSHNLRLTDADGNIATISLTALGQDVTYKFLVVDLTTLTGIDLSRIIRIDSALGTTIESQQFYDGLKLTAAESSGDWRLVADAGAHGGYYVSNGAANSTTTPAATDLLALNTEKAGGIHIPAKGKWYIAVRARSATASQKLNVEPTGVAGQDSPDLPTTAWASNPVWTLVGPFDFPAAGDKSVNIKPAAGNSDFTIEVDAIVALPFERGASSGTSDEFPKDWAHALMWRADWL